MSHHRRSEARRRRAIERRQKAEAEAQKLRDERIRAGLEELMAPADAYAWEPWGYEIDEAADAEALDIEAQAWRDAALRERTQYLPAVEFVLTHEFVPGQRAEVTL